MFTHQQEIARQPRKKATPQQLELLRQKRQQKREQKVKRRLLRQADLEAMGVSDSRQQTHNMMKKYGFPPGISLGAATRAWYEDEVEAWLEKRRIGATEAA